MELEIPRFPASHAPDAETYFVRVPAFLTIDAHAFDSAQFLRQAEGRQQQDEQAGVGAAVAAKRSEMYKSKNQNTIRWKFGRDAATGQMIKQSNARFVRWSDGSLSLQVGAEMFEVEAKPNPDTFLTMSHPQQEILQTTALLNRAMKFIPYSTSSNTHMQLTEELREQNSLGNATVGNVATTDDPEKIKLAALRAEEMTLKARRKLESKRRQLEAREGFGDGGGSSTRRSNAGTPSGASGHYDDDDGPISGSGRASHYDRYEEDDGFVVQDEDEDDEDDARAKRLTALKRQGADKYKNKKRDYSDGDDDEDEDGGAYDESEEEEEEEAQFTDDESNRRASRPKSSGSSSGGGGSKKRRIIDDDDE